MWVASVLWARRGSHNLCMSSEVQFADDDEDGEPATGGKLSGEPNLCALAAQVPGFPGHLFSGPGVRGVQEVTLNRDFYRHGGLVVGLGLRAGGVFYDEIWQSSESA